MKKPGILLLAAALAACGLAVFSACDEPGHTHSFGEWTTVTEPTCTEEGLHERVCACGEKESEDIAAIGHTPSEAIKENEVAATCSAGGSYEEVVYCAACGEELSRKAVEVVSLGHDYVKGVCARCGEAEPYTEGVIFELSEDGASYAVTGYQGAAAEVYIPSYYQGLPVTSIGDWAFYDRSSLTSVTIGDGVTSIGDWAFEGCSSLTSVTIGDGVTSIGGGAFRSCSSLISVSIGDGVTFIGDWAFEGCSSLTSVTIPDSVTSIGVGAFGDCNGLTSISVDLQNQAYHSAGNCLIETQSKTLIAGCETSVIPADGSVTSIGESAFDDCVSLKSITIPDSVTSIGDRAFWRCRSLTSITIPDSVTSIGESAFYNCDGLTSIVIPDSITSIGDWAFGDCLRLTSVAIGNGVTSIGDWAFHGCSSLTSITIPDSVTSIGDSAFYSCDSLETVYYRGSEEEWNEIEIGEWNDDLENANIIFNYTGE